MPEMTPEEKEAARLELRERMKRWGPLDRVELTMSGPGPMTPDPDGDNAMSTPSGVPPAVPEVPALTRRHLHTCPGCGRPRWCPAAGPYAECAEPDGCEACRAKFHRPDEEA